MSEENPETKEKSQFWLHLSKTQKRLAIIIGIMTAVGFLGKCAWWIFEDVNGFIENQRKLDSLYVDFYKFQKSTNLRFDTSLNRKKERNYQHTMTLSKIVVQYLESYEYNGIFFKKDLYGNFYLYRDGILYQAFYVREQDMFYYLDKDGKSLWCK